MSKIKSLRFVVDPGSGCWNVVSHSQAGRGYHHLTHDGKLVYAHRYSYEQLIGPISGGLQVCHTCDNPHCVNPAHLFLGTQKENNRDARRKGRAYTPDSRGVKNGRAKLDVETIKYIRRAGTRAQVLASRFNVSLATVYNIRARRSWRSVGE